MSQLTLILISDKIPISWHTEKTNNNEIMVFCIANVVASFILDTNENETTMQSMTGTGLDYNFELNIKKIIDSE